MKNQTPRNGRAAALVLPVNKPDCLYPIIMPPRLPGKTFVPRKTKALPSLQRARSKSCMRPRGRFGALQTRLPTGARRHPRLPTAAPAETATETLKG